MTDPQAETQFEVAIIGGGFAGLALAFRLRQAAPHHRIVLLEASTRLGGKAVTEIVETSVGRFVIEAGPDSFLAAKPWAKQLAIDLGLEERLLPINMVHRPVSILKQGELIRMPAGLSLAAPALLKPFVRSPLLSTSGRMRVLREPRIRPSDSSADESVADFIRRRLGGEMLDWIAEPLMAGIYNGDPREMGLLATFPQLRAQERLQGGLVRAARSARASRAGSRQPAFLTFQNGIQELTDALARTAEPVARVEATIASVRSRLNGFDVVFESGERLNAAAVVLAIPASQAGRLLGTETSPVAAKLDAFRTNPAGSISLAFPTNAFDRPLPGYGLLIPMKEGRPINAITVASEKFDHRAPPGWTLLRVFFGGARSPETMALDDGHLQEMVLAQLQELLGVSSGPLFSRIYRWPSGSPQYDVGHLDRIAEIEQLLPAGLHLTGSSYRGVGLPDLANEAAMLASKLCR